MNRLRHAIHITRFVLVWFALSVGVAIASPLVNPKGIDMVCSSAGMMKLVVQGEEGGEASSLSMDCPLCAAISAPPPAFNTTLTQPSPLAHVLRPLVQPTSRPSLHPRCPRVGRLHFPFDL